LVFLIQRVRVRVNDKITKTVVCDLETDSLNPTKVWLAVTKEYPSGEVRIFERPDLNPKDFLEYAANVDTWVGHHFIKFDWARVIFKFFPKAIQRPWQQIIDTLVCSRLFNYDIDKGHSLDAWATRLGKVKPKIDDFTQGLTPEMVKRCVEDVEINYELFTRFKKFIDSPKYAKALELEHKMEFVCLDLEEKGFPFNITEARKIREYVDERLKILDAELLPLFPPKPTPIREITPKLTKKGTISAVDFRWLEGGDLTPYSAGSPFTTIEFVPFNPSSSSQRVAVLNSAGWKPFDKTKGHIKAERDLRQERNTIKRKELEEALAQYKITGWKVNEDNLATLPSDAPEGVKKLAQRIVLESKSRTLTEWIGCYNEATGAIHGSFLGIGAWTERMAHQNPNMANVPSHPQMKDKNNPTPVEALKEELNPLLRSLWYAPKGYRMVGVDADGIQLRILAHYMDDPLFTEALVNGDKKNSTDVHSLNALRLGYASAKDYRDTAKTFIYAFLLGVGVDKAAQILYTTNKGAKEKIELFLEATPKLKALRDVQCQYDADRGYFVGLDGRLVPAPSKHHMLAGYLQNGEAVIMKTACVLWRTRLKKEGIFFRHVNFVHDEWQTIVKDDDNEANYIAQVQMDSIVEAGKILNLRCPLKGDKKIGYNWMETH
jgi:DNA polymerase I